MAKVPTWKLILLLVYACSSVATLMSVLSLVLQWVAVNGESNEFLGHSQLQIALNMGVVGLFLGVVLWLSYYIPYRKNSKGNR